MTYTTMPNSEILAAGKQHNMLVINVARGTVVKKVLILNSFMVDWLTFKGQMLIYLKCIGGI
jgi:hypothetical protein